MTVKDLVLNSLEQLTNYKINGATMTNEAYENNADKEVKSWAVYLDQNEKNGYYIEIAIEE